MILKRLIAQKLADLRKTFWYSQKELSKVLWVDRVVYTNIESWLREIKVDELKKLADFFQIQIEYFFTNEKNTDHYKIIKDDKNEIRVSISTCQEEKFKEVFLYILEKLSAKPSFSETVLHKILYFCDFDYYEKYEEFFIGSRYIRNHQWPTSKELIKIIKEMKEKKEIKQENIHFKNWHTWRKYIPLRKADLTKINWAEKEILDNVIQKLGDMWASRISEYVHWDVPRISTADQAEIPYEAVFYRSPQYSVRDYEESDDFNI